MDDERTKNGYTVLCEEGNTEARMNRSDIRQLFDYTEWANALIMGAAAQLSDEHLRRDVQISHKSIFETLQHMAGAEWIWLERWQGRSPVGAQVWPNWKAETPDLNSIQQRWQHVIADRSEFIESLDDARLSEPAPYQLINGTSGASPLSSLMQHVVNHATLHRGQVVGMIRQLGVVPPATDLIFYLRR